MTDYAMFNFDYLFGDHFADVSLKAKLLYVNMSFYANQGFVPNPKQVCKELQFEESVLDELIENGEVLTLPGRKEMFLTSYYVHNKNFNPLNWTKTPYAPYWKGKLWLKRNRIATFSKEKAEDSLKDIPVDPSTNNKVVHQEETPISDEEIDAIVKDIQNKKTVSPYNKQF